MKNCIRKIAGVTLIFFGLIGLVLPFLQGILFIILGASLLGSPWVTRQINRFVEYMKRRGF